VAVSLAITWHNLVAGAEISTENDGVGVVFLQSETLLDA